MLTATRPRPSGGPGVAFGAILRAAAATHGSEPAVRDEPAALDYRALLDAATRVASGLRARGVEPGDRVLIQLPNWWETVAAAWGVFLAGGVLVPVVPIYRERELGFVIDQVEPAAVMAPAEYRGHDHARMLRAVLAATRPAPLITVRGDPDGDDLTALLAAPPGDLPADPPPDDVAVVLYTSGTSAAPKGVLHSHRTLMTEVREVRRWCRLDGSPQRIFMPSPLSHITGLSYGVLLPADLGAEVVLQDRWDQAAAAALVERAGCTFTVSATPFLRGLTAEYAGRGRSSLQTFVCGGADIPPSLVREARHVLGARVLRTYGSTEFPTVTMVEPDADPDAAAGTEGRPMSAAELTVRQDADGSAELLVRGAELFLGYLDPALNADAFTSDGFFRTGDVAELTAAGELRITGRTKDIINRGGEKFSAAEVEAVLLDHPAVADVAVVSYPDPVLVERAAAFVVLAAGADPPGVAELRDVVTGAGLAIQKAPERVVVVAELPRTASGKVQRFRLREEIRSTRGGGPGDPRD